MPRTKPARNRRANDPQSPAFAPLPEQPVERTYKVVGPRRVHDTNPGDTFTATLPLEQAALLIEAGHIKEQR